MKTVKPCPLAQVSSGGAEMDKVSSMGFSLAMLIFLGFCFVLGTMGLWLCGDFYGFDGGCGGMLVVE